MAQQRPNLPANIANMPRHLLPPLPATPPTLQDIGLSGLTAHRLRTSRDVLGNVSNTELGAWEEYHHTLLVTRANVAGAQAAPAWFTQAFAQGGLANVAINRIVNQAIANACAPNGVIDRAINQAITNACAPNGAIDRAIINACAPNGAIDQTVNQAITNACAQNGAIYNLVDISYQVSRARATNANATRATDRLCEFPNMQGVVPSAVGIIFPQDSHALRNNLTLGGYNALLAHYNQPIYPLIQPARESVRVYLGVPPF